MSTTKKLRLGPLSKTERIDSYAALHAQAHGETVDAMTFIPHMLEAFMDRKLGIQEKDAGSSSKAKSKFYYAPG
ncbi:DUF2274 domain-containing protein [Stenotrophomonas maltophilia]|uniref:DUF2274 domain-containing protein n=1 Tax=Stenotrophomonas maltophilia TaxID=40324 RepID=UPI0039C47E2D